MPFAIKIHFSTQLTVPSRILTRHMIHRLRRTILHRVFTGFHQRTQSVALLGIGGRAEKRFTAGRGERVAERSEDEEEEENDGGEETGGDEVEETPLASVAL